MVMILMVMIVVVVSIVVRRGLRFATGLVGGVHGRHFAGSMRVIVCGVVVFAATG